MAKLIAEGGVAGHLAHLYDNRSLTFQKIAEILTAASKGDLIGTEKTDGYNIYLGFKDGEAKAARNKGDMQKGGMNAVDLAMREFQGGEQVKRVYVDSFNAFEAAVASLSDEEKASIFGPNGEIFYNSEIMGPGASNVINYDANVISIHDGGHKRWDDENQKVVGVDTSEQAKALDKVVDRFEQATQGKTFNIQKTAVAKLQRLSGDYDLKIALERIKKAGLEGDMTMEEFLYENLLQDVDEKFSSIDDSLKQQIVNRILKVDNAPTLTQIYRGLGADKSLKEQVRSYVLSGNKTISKIVWPIEDAIHDFAVAMLEGMESAYVLDNAKELARLKKEVETAIKSIQSYQGPGQEMAHEILAKQLRKIKHLDNITSVAEGFVFEYDGQLYKFTGNFAPVNQILGLFRFGRGGIKIPRVDEAKGATETVAIVPGAFKPPHRGHLDMIKHYSDNADRVIVMVSPKEREMPNGEGITQEDSISLWKLYIDKTGLGNVEVVPSPSPSPVRSAYEYVGEEAEPGEMVVLGTSTKGGDQSRFARNVQQYAKEGVRVLDPMKYAFDPVGEELSATDFRNALSQGQEINKFLPSGVEPQDVLDILGIQGGTEEVVEHAALPLFFRLIEEVMNEMEPIQKFYAKNHAEKRMSTKGEKKKGGTPYDISPPKERSKSAPPGFGGSLEEGIIGETWYFGTDGELGENLEPMYLTLSKDVAEAMGKNVYAFKISENSVWYESSEDSYDIDTIGYSDINLEESADSFDVLWDPIQFKEGYETIYVINTSILEISSMAGGSVAGYSLPLGAKPRKKKKNKKAGKPYMEPHMHQDGANLQEISTSSGGSIEQLNFDVTDDEKTLYVRKEDEKKGYPFAGIKVNIKKKKYRHDDIKFPRSRKDSHKYQIEAKEPKKGSGKKPKGSGRRLYTDEDPSDTVSVKFSTVQDIKDTLSKASFKSKSHKRQSQIINLIHQRSRAAYNNAKDPKVKSRLKKAYDYAKERKEASKRKTQRMNKSK